MNKNNINWRLQQKKLSIQKKEIKKQQKILQQTDK